MCFRTAAKQGNAFFFKRVLKLLAVDENLLAITAERLCAGFAQGDGQSSQVIDVQRGMSCIDDRIV